MAEESVDVASMLKRKIYELAAELPVNKDLKENSVCVRDKDTNAVVCVMKTFVSDKAYRVSGYAKIGGQIMVTVGKSEDIKRLQETIGP